MAAQGRGSATYGGAILAGVVLLSLLADAAAKTYIVGDDAGWSKNVEASWLPGKTFYAGDVLVFKYDKERHDLTMLGKKGYERCKLPKHSAKLKVLRTGYETVKLRRGDNYFICGQPGQPGQPGHCKNGMKLFIKAL